MPTINDIISEGFSLHQDGRLNEAETVYQEALTISGENAEVCNLMGVLKLQQNEPEIAIEWVEKAINISPQEYYYETLFQAYIRAGLYRKIADCAGTVIEQFPHNFTLMFNIALAYKNLKQNRDAIIFYNKALKIDPSSYKAWFNLAHIYEIEGEGKNAVSALNICSKLKPHDAETEYFLSIALMRTKNYEKGLKLFENRLCKETAFALLNKIYPNLVTRENMWRGENIKNKTIFVYYEAGFGDVIMFSRYLPLLKQRCKKIIFYPQKPLVPLFAESNLGIDEIVEGYIPEANMDFDVHAPLLSLPYLLKLKGNKVFEFPTGYLKANEALTKEYHQKYFDNERIKIGIKWQGNTYYDKDRVIPTEKFLSLFDIPNTQFYSFQTYEGSEELKKLQEKTNIIDIGEDLIDFAQTAAAIENVDLVICNDTSLAHLAGAMGKPCFVMLPYEVNWRWHDDMSHCDWYSSIKLFRQESIGDWDSVFNKVKKEINTALQQYCQ